MEPYLPTIWEHKAVLERGVEVVEESLRGYGGREEGAVDSAHGGEVGWMIWSRVAPLAVAMYAWWALLAVWRELDHGKPDLLVQLTMNRDKVQTWLIWAFAGLAVVLCVLAFVIWAAVEGIRACSDSGLDPPRECDKSTD